MQTNVLVVEDEQGWSDLIKDILQKRGYHVTVVHSADEVFAHVKTILPDLMILDVNLQGVSGLKICEWLKSDPSISSVPILILTAFNKKEQDKVLGLTVGADDYLTKPFGHEELAARVMALLRRSRGQAPSNFLKAGPLSVDLDKHEVAVKGKAIELRPKEFDILVLLIKNKGKVLRKEFLAEAVWGKDLFATSQTIAQHVKNLRNKLGSCSEYIETIETLGYKFQEK